MVAFLFLIAVPASAHEGRIVLENGSVRCDGTSIWQSGHYRIFGGCKGLTYPYKERVDKYILWVKADDGSIVRVNNINDGIFDA